MISIIIVDDHALFRMGVRTSLQSNNHDIRVVGEAEDGASFFKLLETQTADLVLLDIVLPDISGVDIARRLKKEHPKMKILVLSAEYTRELILKIMQVDADGFITKRMCSRTELAHAITRVMQGEQYFGKDISEIVYRVYVAQRHALGAENELTEQEIRIIDLCREGLTSRKIAERLNLSPRTVDNHKNNIFRKLHINSTLELLHYALDHGIL